jgi:hypothetical protein
MPANPYEPPTEANTATGVPNRDGVIRADRVALLFLLVMGGLLGIAYLHSFMLWLSGHGVTGR